MGVQVNQSSEKLLEHLSWLARLKLTEREKEILVKDITRIIDFFNKLSEVNVENIEPTTHIIELVNVLREDIPRKPMETAEALANAPLKEGGFFKAPRIL
ncbi:MAG: Asp-tRNA(Asn)/Glu-tRNA(Gln) amidotransferase GatCAB subunit C [Thermoprotei archaeon]|nr:MAG: Asp-tRNA(Asn)/Glu-tRNA(Gln) amidotransferase GatCAB subunit C [Thermoprotei archaeon]